MESVSQRTSPRSSVVVQGMGQDGNRKNRLSRTGRYPGHMGFNPFRDAEHSKFDVAVAAVVIVATLALVGWAFLGG